MNSTDRPRGRAGVSRFRGPEESAGAELRLDLALSFVLEDPGEFDVHHALSLTVVPAGTCHVSRG